MALHMLPVPLQASSLDWLGLPVLLGFLVGGIMIMAMGQCLAALREIVLNSREGLKSPAGEGRYAGMAVASWILIGVGILTMAFGLYICVRVLSGPR